MNIVAMLIQTPNLGKDGAIAGDGLRIGTRALLKLFIDKLVLLNI